jgi:selenocysteine lyase/cysteine desulfurase
MKEHGQKVADFINGAKDPSEIVFTGNATEAINLVVWGYAEEKFKAEVTLWC